MAAEYPGVVAQEIARVWGSYGDGWTYAVEKEVGDESRKLGFMPASLEREILGDEPREELCKHGNRKAFCTHACFAGKDDEPREQPRGLPGGEVQDILDALTAENVPVLRAVLIEAALDKPRDLLDLCDDVVNHGGLEKLEYVRLAALAIREAMRLEASGNGREFRDRVDASHLESLDGMHAHESRMRALLHVHRADALRPRSRGRAPIEDEVRGSAQMERAEDDLHLQLVRLVPRGRRSMARRGVGHHPRTPHHTYQILTKRPERIAEHLPRDWGDGYPNVWLGVSVESLRYIERAFMLAQIPARVRFISAEPLLRPVSLSALCYYFPGAFHWLIAGGESGPNCRPMETEWARALRDDCERYGVAFFLKQLGGFPDKRGGEHAVLDGRRHTEMPQVTPVV